MKDNFGREVKEPEAVPATIKLLALLQDNFIVLEDFHPGFTNSVTLVDRESTSAITLVIVESSDKKELTND